MTEQIVYRSHDGMQPISYSPGDEISFVDLCLVLARRRWVVFGVAMTVFIAGAIVALLQPRLYLYTTNIEIGSRIEEGKIVPVEYVETVLSKITSGYIPQLLNDTEANHADDKKEYDIQAKVARNSYLIALESRATQEAEDDIRKLHNEVVSILRQDHSRTFLVIRNDLEQKKNTKENMLETLRDSNRLLTAEIQRAEKMEEFLRIQIEEARSHVNGSMRTREKILHELSGNERIMTMLLVDNELHQKKVRLTDLEQRLQIELSNKSDQLASELAENTRMIGLIEGEMRNIELQQKNILETRILVPTLRSQKMVGTGPLGSALLSLFAGLIAGVFVGFAAEFFAKLKSTAATQ